MFKKSVIVLIVVGVASILLAAEPEEFLLGAGFHFGSGTGDIQANLAIAKQLGLNAGRDERNWNFVEWEKGQYVYGNFVEHAYSQASQSGLRMIYILAYGNCHYDNGNYPVKPETAEAFCKYAEYTVRHFQDRSEFFQVWNEWEGSTSMPPQFKDSGSSAQYVAFLKKVAPRIRAANPNAKIIGNSISSGDQCLDYYLKHGVLDDVDYLAMHTYNFADGPGRDTVDAFAVRMEKIRGMIRAANHGNDFPLFITEMGIPSCVDAKIGRTQHQQAAQLAQILLVCRRFDFIKGFWWYDFQDDNIIPESSEANYGLIRPDTTPKEAAYVMADLAPLIRRGTFVKRIPVSDKRVWILQYKLDGTDVLAVFHTYADGNFKVVFENGSKDLLPVRVRHAGRTPLVRQWGYRDWLKKGQPEWDNRLSVTVQDMPVLMVGDLSAVKPIEIEKRRFPRVLEHSAQFPDPKVRIIAKGKSETVSEYPVTEYRSLNSTGPKCSEFAANFSVHYDEHNLYVEVVVTDKTFFCDQPIEDAWSCDSIQLALQPRTADADPQSWLELDSALTKRGPELYVRRLVSENTEKTTIPAPKISVGKGTVIYHFIFPAELLGLGGFSPGDKLGFSFLVNDNDRNGRRGYLHWADGIGVSKNPAEFGLIELK